MSRGLEGVLSQGRVGTGQSSLQDPGESAKSSRLLSVEFWSSILLIFMMGMGRDEQMKLGRVGMEKHVTLPRFLAAEGSAGVQAA